MDSKQIKIEIARLEGNIKLTRYQIRDWEKRGDEKDFSTRKLEQETLIKIAQLELADIHYQYENSPKSIRKARLEIARKNKRLALLKNAAMIEKLKKIALEIVQAQEMDYEDNSNT